jgi:type II secretory pathway component GspD/PulD (secretin)
MAVDFRNGQLSIVADDAELGKVLHQIGEKTGASVEVAPEVTGERVIAHLGPGPAAEIVSTLLSSPRIDFILMGSEDQGSIKRLIVSRKASFGKEVQQLAPAAPSTSEPESAPTGAQPQPRAADHPASEPAQEAPPQ